MIQWVVYYDDGSSFSSKDGAPQDSPKSGMVLFGQVSKRINWTVRKGQHFIFRSDTQQWYGCDDIGLVDQLTHFAEHIVCYRLGRWTTDDMLLKCETAAKNHPDIPTPSRLT